MPYCNRLFSRYLPALLLAAMVAIPAAAAVELDPIEPRLAGANPDRGQTLFLQCKACHVAEKGAAHTVGPNLWNVVGRPVGSIQGYDYTDSLEAIGGVWDFEALSRYLFDPAAMAPGTRMILEGIKRAEDRADLIAYLATLNDREIAMPQPAPATGVATYGGLPAGEGREAVYFTCRACHALDQFTEEQLDREGWDALVDEMVAKNGMAAPEPWARTLMLDYLATHFGAAPKEEDWAGLPPGPGREEVYYTCKTCHSLQLVTQQGMSKSRWDNILVWMVEEQGMSEIEDAAVRDLILDYLASHFGS